MKNKSSFLLVVSCAYVLISAAGCSLIKNMGEMHDATNDMNAKMSETNKSIKDTNTSATNTEKNVAVTACIAGETYTALRQGNSEIARVGDDALGKMSDANAIEEKIFRAGAYMKAFEFQIWNCADPNSELYLKTFYQQAAEEFTRVLPNYLTTDRSKWSVSTTSTNSHVNDLYALAVSLQELNANIVTAYKLGKWADKPQSMLDLIESSFTRKTYLAAHPGEVTQMDTQFLANEDLLVQLLQIRMNFLAAMALAKVSNLEVKGTLGLPGLVREVKMLFGGWTPNLAQFSTHQDLERVKFITRFIYGSNDMRAYLLSIGVRPYYDTTIYKMYAHMRTGGAVQPEIPNAKSDADLAFNNTQRAIKGYLAQLKLYMTYDDGEFMKNFAKIPELDHPEFFSY